MYAAVPILEVLVPFMLKSPDWIGSTASKLAAEKVYKVKYGHVAFLATYRESKVRHDGFTFAVLVVSHCKTKVTH
jgi:hypothetical protein